MATVAAARTPTKAKNPDDVRAAAMAVLQMADERTAKGATVAKHRSPLPERASMANNKNNNKNTNIAARASQSSQQSDKRGSFNLLSWGKKTMGDMKEKMSELDEKFLAMQFEQEEKFRKAYDKTTADLSEMLASPAKKNSKATPETPISPLASVVSSPKSAPPKTTNNQEGPTAMSRFRSSFAGFTQKLAPQPQPPKKPPSVDEQIVAELEQLHELMTLCHTLLAEKNDLINLIDYEPDPRLPHTIKRLESSLGRMDQLMESGIDGQFQDDTTQICVSTYERLILTLEKCNSPLVKSNAFAFAKDLEGDSEFDEAPQTPSAAASDTAAKSPAKEAEDTTAVAETTTTSPDLALDGLDADMDIDLAAFEIGSDDEDDILNTTSPSEDEEKKTDADDDFIKDMF